MVEAKPNTVPNEAAPNSRRTMIAERIADLMEAEFGPRAKVEIAVDDAIVDPVVEAVANVARTGRAGDGRIIVSDLEQAIRIRTGEFGEAAT